MASLLSPVIEPVANYRRSRDKHHLISSALDCRKAEHGADVATTDGNEDNNKDSSVKPSPVNIDTSASIRRRKIQQDDPQLRLKRIQIHRSDAIDQIKFQYDDDTTWITGHDGGKADPRHVVLTDGEYLVSVSHEQYVNYRAAGAGITFVTNKHRTFDYQPACLSTKQKSEITTLTAKPGYEIIKLIIRRGTLEGIEQQPVPAKELISQPKEWYAIAVHEPKKCDTESGNTYTHYHSRSEAMTAWQSIQSAGDTGCTALFIDCVTTRVLKFSANSKGQNSVNAAKRGAISDGYCTPRKEEEVSIVDAVTTLLYVLKQPGDILNFLVVTTLLSLSSFLELQSAMLTGKVLTMPNAKNATDLVGDSYGGQLLCSHWIDCNSMYGAQKAMIITFVTVKMASRLAYVANVYIHHNACASKNQMLGKMVFKHVLSLDQSYFDTHSLAEIKGGMNVHALNDLITWNVPYMITKFLKLCFVVAFMLHIDSWLAIICILSALLIKYGVLDTVSIFESRSQKLVRKLELMKNQVKDDTLSMITSIKMFSTEDRHTDLYADASHRKAASMNFIVILRCLREFGYGSLRVVTFGIVLYVGLARVAQAGITSASLVSFFMIFNDFQELFGSFKWHYERLVEELPDIDRYLSLMSAEPAIVTGSDKLEDGIDGEIEFKDVWMEYPSRPGEPALKGLNLTIKKKKMTAIVGESGAGKSTISKLLLRMYDPSRGTISCDGKDLRSLDVESLHNRIAIVNQSPDLFNSSIGDNIAYGAVDYNTCPTTKMSDRVKEAAMLANCFDFISKLRGGFDTIVGGRGSFLSGGQRQRIAIARAAIRDPDILILDEATSALDAESEKAVQKALDNIMVDRTTIVIAHRLSTIRNADEIVCMKNGVVAEQGTHSELMSRKGSYFNLISKQLMDDSE